MQVDGKTEIAAMQNQTLEEIAYRINALCTPLAEPTHSSYVQEVLKCLCNVWLAGYQQGVLEESRRGR